MSLFSYSDRDGGLRKAHDGEEPAQWPVPSLRASWPRPERAAPPGVHVVGRTFLSKSGMRDVLGVGGGRRGWEGGWPEGKEEFAPLFQLQEEGRG